MFGKNLKKFFGTVLSAAMVVSAMPVFTIGAYADETETISKTYVQETFDNGMKTITEGDGYIQDESNTNIYKKTTDNGELEVNMSHRIEGDFDGNPGIGTRDSAWEADFIKYTFNDAVNTGTLAVSFDVSRNNYTVENTDWGAGRSQMFMFFEENGQEVEHRDLFIVNFKNTGTNEEESKIYGPNDDFSGWSDNNIKTGFELNKKYNICQILDFDGDKIYTYVNGELLSEKNLTKTDGLKYIKIRMSQGIKYFDNFKVQSVAKGTSTFKAAADNAGYAVKVKFDDPVKKADLTVDKFEIKDSQDSTAKVKSVEFKDPYTAIVRTEEYLKAGSYTLKTTVKNALGASAESEALSFVVKEKQIFEETFDDGVDTLRKSPYTLDGTWGTRNVSEGVFEAETNAMQTNAFEDNNGVGYKIDQWTGKKIGFKFNEKKTSGVIYYSFDISRLDREYKSVNDKKTDGDSTATTEDCMASHTRINVDKEGMNSGTAGWYDLYVAADIGIYGPNENWWSYGNINTTIAYDKNIVYNVEQIIDLNAKKCHTYVDGTLLSTVSISDRTNVENIYFYLGGSAAYFDNLRIQYMSEYGETFKVFADKLLDNNATEVTVNFEDPVAKDVIKADNFEVKAADGTAVNVTAAEWVSPYEAKVKFDALESGNYTVSAQNITTAVGATADDTAMSFRVKTDGLYVDSFNEDNGTYTVNLKNDADDKKGAVLVAGVFVGGKLIECVTDDTFEGDAATLDGGADGSLSVTLTHANDEGAAVKVFLWDSLANAKPLAEALN